MINFPLLQIATLMNFNAAMEDVLTAISDAMETKIALTTRMKMTAVSTLNQHIKSQVCEVMFHVGILEQHKCTKFL